MIKPPVGLVAAGGFKKLPLHVGALYRYFGAEEEGLVPHPAFAIGSSAGAIAWSSCLPWTEKNFKEVACTILNLKKSDIYTIRHQIKLMGSLAMAGSFLSLLHLVPRHSSRWKKLLIESARVTASLAAEGAFFRELLEQPSLFSNQPLQHFLSSHFNFEGIWNADIRFEVPAVDIHTGEEYIFELDKNRNHPDRDSRLMSAILASASMPAHFPLVYLDGHWLDDAAILNNIPIHRALLAGCETTFVLLYSGNGPAPSVTSWIEELTRALDIAVNEITRKTLGWHISINQDLAVIKGIEQDLASLEEGRDRFKRLAVAPEQEAERAVLISSLEEGLNQLRARLKGFAFSGKKLTTIIPVMSSAPIPDQYFRKFNRELMRQAMEIGYEAMDQTLREVART